MKRIVATLIAVIAITLAGASQAFVSASNDDPHQVVVCKYVGTPGPDERLQTGQNPIVVDIAALEDGFDGTFPFEFSDKQGRSVAIRYAANSHDGDISECPGYVQPTPTPEVTPSPVPSTEPSSNPSPTPVPTPTVTPSESPLPSASPSESPTPSVTPTPVPSVVPTPSTGPTAKPTPPATDTEATSSEKHEWSWPLFFMGFIVSFVVTTVVINMATRPRR
jgi:hypothetical protein